MNQFKLARKAGVPLIAIETSDPAQTIKSCVKTLNGKAEEVPVMEWDIIRGLVPVNKAGVDAMANEEIDPMMTLNPAEFLGLIRTKAARQKNALIDSVIFFHMGNRFIEGEGVCQGIWNLRDVFKGAQIQFVILGPSITLPAELKHDVVVLTDPLPDSTELKSIVRSILDDCDIPIAKEQTPEQMDHIADILRGLSAFAAEQVMALSIKKTGVDLDELWQRKKKMIEQTPGLQVWKGGESFTDLGGLTNLKEFLTKVLSSSISPVRAVLYIDEIEKQLGGAQGDTSGTSQDQLGSLLQSMQNDNLPGIILIGHCGCGKSAIAKAAGNVADAPVIACDLGAMKGSLVGQSEARIRAAMDVFRAISQGKGLVIATCNRIASLPPELRRRFSLGTFLVDLPDEDERKAIWPIWLKKYGIKEKPLEDCEGFSGAEIRAICDVSYRTGLPLKEAVKFIVPVIKSAPDQVEALRKMAHGRFISASKPGIYKYSDSSVGDQPAQGRRITV